MVRMWVLFGILTAAVVLFLAGYATSERTPTHPATGAVSHTLVGLSILGYAVFIALGIITQVRARRSREG
ncbi:MAG: hypothetical protein ABSC90_17415 [Acidimicrobiales bacterium]|jgi:hypothetical protein